MAENSLSVAFSNSLKEEAIACISDLTEIGLDAIMDDGILKDVPILSTAISLYKIGSSIKERHNLKKLLLFINEINNGIADSRKRTEYQQKFQSDDKFRNQQIEYLLVLIDRYTDYDKSKWLAKLFLAYLEDEIIWEELLMYAEVIDRFLLLDCRTLISTDGTITVHRNIGGESVSRLVSLGLMAEKPDISTFAKDENGELHPTWTTLYKPQSFDKIYVRTEFGDKLAEILK